MTEGMNLTIRITDNPTIVRRRIAAFVPDATGPFSDRAQFNARPQGFSFLATDLRLLYFRYGAAGTWSVGAPFPGAPGPTGQSAYELAVELGFSGDEAAWIASIKGEPGDPATASQHLPHQTLNASGSIDPAADLILCNTTTAPINAQLPSAAAVPDREYTIKNVGTGANLLRVLPSAGQYFDLATITELDTDVPGDVVTVRACAGYWQITSQPVIWNP